MGQWLRSNLPSRQEGQAAPNKSGRIPSRLPGLLNKPNSPPPSFDDFFPDET
jgi:hypothetical protein